MKTFNNEFNENEIQMVKFGATWCGPCNAVDPIIERLFNDGYNVSKVDADEDPDSIIKYRITNVPTYILFKGDKEIARDHGVKTYNDFVDFMRTGDVSN